MEFTKNSTKTTNKKRRGLKVLLALFGFIILLIAGLSVARLIYRQTLRNSHAIQSPGIDLMETVEIGGIQQCLYFRGQNEENPVILFLHGGPGSAMIPTLHGFQYDWEEDFTVVQWDQRMAGKTYFANDPNTVAQTMSFEQMLDDAWEVTQYVQNKLGKEKIIIMGHSWGSLLGTALVQTYPDAFLAYIGTGQVVNMMENERVGYEKVLEMAVAANNEKDIETLKSLAPYPAEQYGEQFMNALMTVKTYQMKYGIASGTSLDTLMLVMGSPYYSLSEVGFFFKDLTAETDVLNQYMFEQYDAHNYDISYSVPVFYIMGENDFQTPEPLAVAFFEEIKAPIKRYYTVPEAGHTPMLENNEEYTRILLEEIRPELEQFR